MKRIAIVTAVLALVTTGVAFAGAKPAADCSCQATTQTQSSGLSAIDLTR